MRFPPTPSSSRLEQFCPACQGLHLHVAASVVVRYEVVLESDTGEIVVVGERWGESEWDASSLAECPSCGWQGTLQACLS